jgi:selenium metabolism protein YedF
MSKRILILSDRVGRGDDDLGRLLMKNLIYALARADDAPRALTLMNEGVRLACQGSESLDDLSLCVERGVAVKSCGTCLDVLGLKESVVVGDVGTMVDSVAALLGEDDVVTIC